MTRQKTVQLVAGSAASGAAGWLVDHAQNASATLTNRVLKAGGQVRWAKKPVTAGGKEHPAGAVFMSAQGIPAATMDKWAKELGLVAAAAGSPGADVYELKKPRLAVYQSWLPSAEEGWVRFILEQHEFAYTTLHDANVRAGHLRENYDVVVLPDHYSADAVIEGYAKGTMPPQYVGGLGAHGLAGLKKFVEDGGTLICLNAMSNLALERFGLPMRNVLKGVKAEEFTCSGSILRLAFDAAHPVAYGMPAEAGAVFAEGCAFDLYPSFEGKKETKSVATYAAENVLMSGYIFGEKLIQRKTALAEVPLEKGRIILFGFPATYRAQPHGTFKLLFNAIFYGAATAGKP